MEGAETPTFRPRRVPDLHAKEVVVVPPAGLEPATCALRRRLLCFLAYVMAKSELGDSVRLDNGAANQHLPSGLGGRWEWRGVALPGACGDPGEKSPGAAVLT
jgi:hypothetical protein